MYYETYNSAITGLSESQKELSGTLHAHGSECINRGRGLDRHHILGKCSLTVLHPLHWLTTFVSAYKILQGISPMFIAGFSDSAGRRPAYMICFTVYLAANLGLGLQNSYVALLVIQCVQSAGSSGTGALANGLVGDVVTSEERGKYVAFVSLGAVLGPTLSPIIGGLISHYLNLHWIFWILLILGGVFFLFLLLFLPETCRKVVGDGSVPPPLLNISITDLVRQKRRKKKGLNPEPEKVAEVRKTTAYLLPFVDSKCAMWHWQMV